MEDMLNFNETKDHHWHAEYDNIQFDIEQKGKGYELHVEGGDVNKTLECSSLGEAKDKAMKFLVW